MPSAKTSHGRQENRAFASGEDEQHVENVKFPRRGTAPSLSGVSWLISLTVGIQPTPLLQHSDRRCAERKLGEDLGVIDKVPQT